MDQYRADPEYGCGLAMLAFICTLIGFIVGVLMGPTIMHLL